MQYGTERNISQVCWGAMINNHAVGEHGKRVRIVPSEHAHAQHAEAAPSVDVVNEHQFATIGVSLFQRREFSRFRAEGFGYAGALFFVLSS